MKHKLITSILILTLFWPAHSTYAMENGCLRPLAVGEGPPVAAGEKKNIGREVDINEKDEYEAEVDEALRSLARFMGIDTDGQGMFDILSKMPKKTTELTGRILGDMKDFQEEVAKLQVEAQI